jgi:hypothetical protein
MFCGFIFLVGEGMYILTFHKNTPNHQEVRIFQVFATSFWNGYFIYFIISAFLGQHNFKSKTLKHPLTINLKKINKYC